MLSKLIHLALLLVLLGIHIGNSCSLDVACIHFKDGVVHIEKEHPELPDGMDGVHVKLISEVYLDVFKPSLDTEFQEGKGLIQNIPRSIKRQTSLVYNIPTSKQNHPIKTVRLLI